MFHNYITVDNVFYNEDKIGGNQRNYMLGPIMPFTLSELKKKGNCRYHLYNFQEKNGDQSYNKGFIENILHV